ncbi:MAG: hypothetical protein JNK58_13935 [Phycisphaerae bacterium]|nr:hypothetical protein [Phycisphaerae bacterium]
MRTYPLRLLLTAAMWLCCCAGRVWAGDAASGAGLVPSDVDLLVVVDDGAGWRSGPGGRWMLEAFRGATAESEMDIAWRGLAAALRLDGDRAFDELLGRRVVFARRSTDEGDRASPWVVVSIVSDRTEALIRERLRASPRRVAGGVSVLSLEDGRFWLATSSSRSGATVMLGPSAASGLFDEMLGTIGRNAPRSLLGSKLGDDLRAVQPGASAIVFLRRRDAEGRLVLTGVGAKRVADGVEVGLLARSQLIAERVGRVGHTSRALFDAIAPSAYFAAVEWDVPGLLGALGLEWPTAALFPALANFEGKEWIGPRSAYVVGRNGEDGVAAAAFQSKDTPRLAVAGDRLMGSIAQMMWEPRGLGEADAVMMDFGGRFPDARREVDLSRTRLGGASRAWFRNPALAWAYHAEGDEGGSGGWWIVGVGARSVHVLGDAVASERDAGEAPTAPWLSLGIARPAALFSALREGGFEAPAVLSPLTTACEMVDSFTWSLRRGDGGSIRGDASIRLLPMAEGR